jgi:hypothetical protein
LVEQLIRNQQVIGSSPIFGSSLAFSRLAISFPSFLERLRGDFHLRLSGTRSSHRSLPLLTVINVQSLQQLVTQVVESWKLRERGGGNVRAGAVDLDRKIVELAMQPLD